LARYNDLIHFALLVAKSGYSRFFVANTSKIGGKIKKRRAFRMAMMGGPSAFLG
jgi:hypothetical protein